VAIAPSGLLELVRFTAPFLFEGAAPQGAETRFIRVLRDHQGERPDALRYYELCLSAHWATAGTFVPTDVDNAIRWKLWQEAPSGLVGACADLVLESLGWDYGGVTGRIVRAPSGARLSTHEGTWFSVAVGAYAACSVADPPRAAKVLSAMLAEAEREHAAFREIAATGDGVSILKACALIAHNFGDLDRVADQWELKRDDPLMLALYDAAKPGSPLFGGLLGWAGELNKRFMGADNHRHYPLRAAKGLRKSPDLLIPVGPFFDDWGMTVARHPVMTAEEKGDAACALIDGWVRLHEPTGYARGLAGMVEVFPRGRDALGKLLPGAQRRMIMSGPLKKAMDIPRARFESQWAGKVKQVPAVGR
jgi:hypothetical protein